MSVARIRTVVVLPAPFGPEQREDGAARDRQVDAVEDPHRPVRLLEADRLDRVVCHVTAYSFHGRSAYAIRSTAYGIRRTRMASTTEGWRHGRRQRVTGLPASLAAAWGRRGRPAKGPKPALSLAADRRRGGRGRRVRRPRRGFHGPGRRRARRVADVALPVRRGQGRAARAHARRRRRTAARPARRRTTAGAPA